MLDVLIVGAGPSGLTLALELARRDASVRIVDSKKAPTDTSNALAVHARTLEVLLESGVSEELIARGRRIDSVVIYSDARPLNTIRFDRLPSMFPFVLSIPQSETERVLIEALEHHGVHVEWNTRVAELRQDKMACNAQLERSDGTQESAVAAYVVGCDGAHSTVRHALGLPFEGSQYPQRLALADFRLEGNISTDQFHVFLHPAGLDALFPFAENRCRAVLDVTKEPHLGDEGNSVSHEQLKRWFAQRGLGHIGIGDIRWTSLFHVHHRHVKTMQAGRVFLAGDAAHIHSPAGGMGMNTAIQDAHNLAWKLALVVSRRASPKLLESYDRERLPVMKQVMSTTDAMLRTATMTNPLLTELRDLAIRALVGNELLNERGALRVSGAGVSYRGSGCVRGTAKLLGESAGDYVGRIRGGDPAKLQVLTKASIDIDRTLHPELLEFYELRDDARCDIAVVRPDGYLGYCGTVHYPHSLHDFEAYVKNCVTCETGAEGHGVLGPTAESQTVRQMKKP